MKKIGIALGGGGARGFAHIAYLKALDEMGLVPSVISGTSMGAVIGALYACGYTPSNLLEALRALSSRRLSSPGMLKKLQLLPPAYAARWVKKLLLGFFGDKKFSDINITLKTVAVDFHSLEEKIFSSGLVMDGVMASIALPGFFPPYYLNGRYYIDGGAVNLVPFNVIRDKCDILIAIDVNTQKNNEGLEPTAQNSYLAAWNAISSLLLKYQLAGAEIDILERPDFQDIGVTHFEKYMQVYERTLPLTEGFKKRLKSVL